MKDTLQDIIKRCSEGQIDLSKHCIMKSNYLIKKHKLTYVSKIQFESLRNIDPDKSYCVINR